ncbi:hypothetical protein [Silvibacterium acidisoli]|uniref:hypothetical protein n=1 Tax=Acidobacteriaceae bacterium ZG23-2 TaxID=2883246 RepID=UPI00406D3765
MPELLDRLETDLKADPLLTTIYVCSADLMPALPYVRDHYYCFEDFTRLVERIAFLTDHGFIRDRTRHGEALRRYDIGPALIWYLENRPSERPVLPSTGD